MNSEINWQLCEKCLKKDVKKYPDEPWRERERPLVELWIIKTNRHDKWFNPRLACDYDANKSLKNTCDGCPYVAEMTILNQPELIKEVREENEDRFEASECHFHFDILYQVANKFTGSSVAYMDTKERAELVADALNAFDLDAWFKKKGHKK